MKTLHKRLNALSQSCDSLHLQMCIRDSYRDKPVAEWDIREDGRIVGVTEELSAQEIYEMGRKVEPFVIAKDTRMGHIHLSVKDSQLATACLLYTSSTWTN